MRFAYADPPYPGQAKRWYGNHPDYAGEVDHPELIARLEHGYPDGWALSTNAISLPTVLRLCPLEVRVAAWWNRASQPPGAVTADHWWWSWEPVIIRGGRRGGEPVRNHLACGMDGSAGRFPGGKPAAFTRWVLALLGAVPSDDIDDLFPGSGAVSWAIESWRRQPGLPLYSFTPAELFTHDNQRGKARRISRTHDPLPEAK